jgi:putative inorganic carbon (hco3(-)) transporter
MGYRQPSDYESVAPARRPASLDSDASDASSFATDWRAPARETGSRDPVWTKHADSTDTRTDASPAAPDPADTEGQTNAPAPSKFARRGHLLSFAGLFLFTVVLYFRPYELFPALAGFTSLAFWIAVPTLAVFFVTQFTREGNLTARPREVKLVLLFAVAALLSIPLALNRTEAWGEFDNTFDRAVLMFIVMVNVVRTERRLRTLLWLALAASCFLAVSAINDFRLGNLADQGERVAGAVGGMFGNPNDLALHLVTMVPIAIAFFFTKRNPLSKVLYAICAALLIAGIVVTFSRGGFLGLIGAGGVLAWKLGRRHKLAVGMCVLVAALGFVALAPGEYATRLGTITSVASDVTGSSSQRQQILIRSLLVTARHPLFGVGMGNFHIVSIHELVSHNAFTQVSAELGLAALVLYVWFMIAPLRRLREIERETFAARRASRFYYLAVGLQAALVGYMVSSFFASVAYNFYVYYLVGYAVALHRLYEAARVEEHEQAISAQDANEMDATSGADEASHAAALPNSESYA